jgi:K+/H+ antiporter YhaU regulatory subunit KhtT
MLTEIEMRADTEARHAHRELVEELEAKLAKAVEALVFADNNLTNLQPKIPQLISQKWIPVIDGFVDPVIVNIHTTLAELKGETDE